MSEVSSSSLPTDVDASRLTEVGGRRFVFQVEEYDDVALPVELIINDGRLDIYPELLRTTVLRSYSRDGKLLFQAGGWIGLVPINERVALEIRPRVPIANLERILCIASNATPIILPSHLRQFEGITSGLPASFLDVLAERLIAVTEACWNEGLHFEYVRRVRVGQNPRGRVLPFKTVQNRIRTHDLLLTVSEQYERTHDTAPNQCIAAALDVLYSIYSAVRNRSGARSLASRLGRARQLFVHSTRTSEQKFLADPLVRDPTRLPASRPTYPAAIALAKIILSGDGVNFRSTRGQISLPSMMISMEQAFEGYLRAILLQSGDDLLVCDGNINPPAGAASKLFHSAPVSSPLRAAQSTPDIVCAMTKAPNVQLVIDAKYKKDITRDDLNQVLGYALTYRSSLVILACPRKAASSPSGLCLLGEVSGIKAYQYFVDLGAIDLPAEELAFSNSIRALLA